MIKERHKDVSYTFKTFEKLYVTFDFNAAFYGS